MTGDKDHLEDREERLCEVLAAYFEAVKAGRAPEREAWLARHPDLADDLVEFLEEQDRLLRMTEPLRSIVEEAECLVQLPGRAPAIEGRDSDGQPTELAPVIGSYSLLGEIDRGGAGVVYRARQRGLNRAVALKMLRAGVLADSDDVRRFHIEAEAVAQLDHPNIVPVFEVGDHDGFPYLVMKLIEGASLARRIGDYAGDPRAAARLLATVARAIHHAHQRGILHRDLKPSNILIDEQGQPHVTDFGLARLVAGDSELTRTGAIVGTASYMAPEQATGRRGATMVATDVYGLGAVLYAILSGEPPFQGDSALETLERVRHKAPESLVGFGRSVDRDLETICLKCLEKEPGRRYDSALAVAEDLERWLRGEPIAARPVARLDRAWRWCRRNPLVAVLSASVSALLLTGLVGLTVGNHLLTRQRDAAREGLAEARLQRQREAYNFSIVMERASQLVEVLHQSKPGEGPEQLALRHEMGEKALDLIRIFLEERGDDATMRIEAVYAHRVLGSVYRQVRTREDSYSEFDQAKKLAERLVGDYPDVTPYRVELGRIHNILGLHYEQDGRLEESEREYRAAGSEFLRAAELEPDNANALNMLAWFLTHPPAPRFRDPPKAIYWAKRALAVAKEQEQGRVWDTLGLAYYRNGDWRAAIAALERACQVRADRGNDHTFFALAMAYWRAGEPNEAERYYGRAIEWNTHRSMKPENAPLFDEATRLLGRLEGRPTRP
jgi:tetratricopeptide (TPR) repeat protein